EPDREPAGGARRLRAGHGYRRRNARVCLVAQRRLSPDPARRARHARGSGPGGRTGPLRPAFAVEGEGAAVAWRAAPELYASGDDDTATRSAAAANIEHADRDERWAGGDDDRHND